MSQVISHKVTCGESGVTPGTYDRTVSFRFTQLESAAGKMNFKVEIKCSSDAEFTQNQYHVAVSITMGGTTKSTTGGFSVSANTWRELFSSFVVTSTAESLTPSIWSDMNVVVSGYTISGILNTSDFTPITTYAAYTPTIVKEAGVESVSVSYKSSNVATAGKDASSVVYRGDVLSVTAEPVTGWYIPDIEDVTVPQGGVTITVTANKIRYDLIVTADAHSTVRALVGGVEVTPGVDAIEYGDILAIITSADTGYKIKSRKINDEDSEAVSLEVTGAVTIVVASTPMATVTIGDKKYLIHIGNGATFDLFQAGIGNNESFDTYF